LTAADSVGRKAVESVVNWVEVSAGSLERSWVGQMAAWSVGKTAAWRVETWAVQMAENSVA
jgi:hypothetical protein